MGEARSAILIIGPQGGSAQLGRAVHHGLGLGIVSLCLFTCPAARILAEAWPKTPASPGIARLALPGRQILPFDDGFLKYCLG